MALMIGSNPNKKVYIHNLYIILCACGIITWNIVTAISFLISKQCYNQSKAWEDYESKAFSHVATKSGNQVPQTLARLLF